MTNRLNVVFSEPQRRWLEKEAKRLGIAIGELIRRIIDQHRDLKRATAAHSQNDGDPCHNA